MGAAPPSRFSSDRWATLVTSIATAALAVPLWAAPWNVFDGGITASAASFTLHGLVPYRDYWLLYGPLSGWLLAIPTAIIGPSVELTRLMGLAVLAAQSAIVYRLCLRWTLRFPASLLALSSSLLVAAFMGLEISAWTLSMTLCLMALSFRLDARRPLLVGVLLGLAFLTRLDVGAYALLASLLLNERRLLLIGFATIVVPPAIAVLVLSPISFLVEQLVWYPLVGPRQFRGLPGLEVLMPMAVAAPLTFVLAIVPRLAIAVTLVRALADGRRDLLVMAVFAALCQLQTLGRADAAHLAVATTPAVVLIGAMLPRGRRTSLFGIGIVAPALFAAAAAGMLIASSGSTTRDFALRRSIETVRQVTQRDDAIHVGLASNRHTTLNAMLAYYLADRRPGSHWTMYNPGVTNTDLTQAAMVAELEATGTNILILDTEWVDGFEITNDSRISGSTVLDRYIEDRFRIWCDFGAFRVDVRVAWNPDRPCLTADGA